MNEWRRAVEVLRGMPSTPPPVLFGLLHRCYTSPTGMVDVAGICEEFGIDPVYPFAAAPMDAPPPPAEAVPMEIGMAARERAEDKQEKTTRRDILNDDDWIVEDTTDEEEWETRHERAPNQEEDITDSEDERAPRDADSEDEFWGSAERPEGHSDSAGHPIRVGNVYRMETEEESNDQTLDTSFFMVLEVDPDGISHKGVWLYTHAQIPFTIPDTFHGRIDAALRNDMWAVFVSDHSQRLGGTEDWVNVTPVLRYDPDVDPVQDGVCVLGTMRGERLIEGSFVKHLIDQLTNSLGTRRSGFFRRLNWDDVWYVASKARRRPHTEERCAVCLRKQPIVADISVIVSGQERSTHPVGRVCNRRVMAIWNLTTKPFPDIQEAIDALTA